ncbi:oxidoreductase-like protein [Myxozyma melibiosi]|uniref:Oxidoreductase-like protein n=1 Tax=Myxozyma melibiosi TaxID=54550 RepID=A0ABR1FCV4_9ASCO
MTQAKVLRIGVAGAGRMGQIHIQNMLEIRRLKVTAVCSVLKSELKWAEETIGDGVKTFEDYDSFLASDLFDAVLIVTPSGFHKEQAIKAMRAGKHVFCEKPIAPDAASAWEVYYESLKHPDLKVACGFPRRYAAPYVEARKRIERGDIGDVVTLRSQTTDPYQPGDYIINYIKTSGGIFVDACIHDIDACLFLLGADKVPETAYATGSANVYPMFKDFGDVDDGVGLVTFTSGDTVMSVYGSRINRHAHHSMTEVTGTKGKLVISGQPRQLQLDISDANGTRMEGPQSQMEQLGPAFKQEIEAFRDWILDDVKPNFNLKDAAKAVSIGAALMESLRQKSIAKIELPATAN